MKVTIVSSEINEKLALSSRNVPYVSMVKASSCSVRDLYDNDVIIIDISGLEVLSSRFGDKN
jgi:large subunit ribosomal protein L4